MIHTYHKAAETRRIAAVKALNAGIDVEAPTVACYGEDLLAALKAGEITIETIDLSVSRHLQKKFELGLFENPYVSEGDVLNVFETKANRSLAYDIACQSFVLLKNDGLLPLKDSVKKLAVIGPSADSSRILAGDYSYIASAELQALLPAADSTFATISKSELENPTVVVPTLLEAIKNRVSPSTRVSFSRGCDINSTDESGFKAAVQAAEEADAVVLVLGGKSGLVPDCTTGEFRDASDLGLPGVQEKLALAVLESGKPCALVLINGRPAAIPDLVEKTHAIMQAWVPGEEGARAITSVLFGDVNPGGKLPLSIPRSAGQLPVFYNHKPSGMRSQIFGDYYNEQATPLFPFGHGISYSSFKYNNLTLNKQSAKPGEIVGVSMSIQNTSQVTGDEVVQLYSCDEIASLPRPVKELKGFVRLTLLPGETKKITFHLPVNQLAYYDEELKLVVEPGNIKVMIGSSSEDIRLVGEFKILGKTSIKIAKRLFVCPVEVI